MIAYQTIQKRNIEHLEDQKLKNISIEESYNNRVSVFCLDGENTEIIVTLF